MYHFFVKPEEIILYHVNHLHFSEEDGEDLGEAPEFREPSEIGLIRITGSDVNHIRNVLRMKEGEELLLSDGEGMDYHCAIWAFEKDAVLCRILDLETSRTEPAVQFFLFQGLPKADKMEHIVQKSVELGVFEIIPVETARSVVKYDEKKKKSRRERWQKIAEGAAKQSHRGIIPEVKPVMRLPEAMEYAAQLDLVLIPYENFKDMKATKEVISGIHPGMRVGLFIGPEGGFEQEEVNMATERLFQEDSEKKAALISLGNRILRTETAPLMLLSVLLFQLE